MTRQRYFSNEKLINHMYIQQIFFPIFNNENMPDDDILLIVLELFDYVRLIYFFLFAEGVY